MAISRHISFPLHTVVELSLGLFVLIAPAALHVSTLGMVLGVALGALIMGLAINGSGVMDGPSERPPLSLETHHLADMGVGLALMAAAIVMALAGDLVAGLTFAAGAIAERGLELWTRYTVPEQPKLPSEHDIAGF